MRGGPSPTGTEKRPVRMSAGASSANVPQCLRRSTCSPHVNEKRNVVDNCVPLRLAIHAVYRRGSKGPREGSATVAAPVQ